MDRVASLQPLFSIIVPAYNVESLIEKCIQSVLDQTYSDFELIIVDDGSQDSTLEVCTSYASSDPRIKVFHKQNGGHTSARNEGLKNSTGKYILFLDSDDWLTPQTLACCSETVSDNDSDIVIFNMKAFPSEAVFPVLISDGHYILKQSKTNILNDLLMRNDGHFAFPRSLSAKCFKRELIYSNQIGIPKEIIIGEDGAVFVASALQSNVISVIAHNSPAMYCCLERNHSVSRSSDALAFTRLPYLFSYCKNALACSPYDFSEQFNRYIVAQLYTASLLVSRSGKGKEALNHGLNSVLQDPLVDNALRKAKFSLKGYKFLIKKCILRYQWWTLAKILDK